MESDALRRGLNFPIATRPESSEAIPSAPALRASGVHHTFSHMTKERA